MRRVLITGSTGYVGTVVAPLVAQKYKVRSFDTQAFGNALAGVKNIESVQGDITDPYDVKAAMEGVTDVIHLAGIVTDDLVDMNKVKGHLVNVVGTERLLEAAVAAGVSRFVYASSSSVYGLAAQQFKYVTESCEPIPQTEYARQKLAGERLVLAYSDKMITTAVRSATACGPAPRMRLDTVVNVFSKQAWFDGLITVHGGQQFRSNIHVADVADLYKALLDAEKVNGEVFNATFDNHTVLTIANIVADQARKRKRKVKIEVQPVEDVRSYRLHASKARHVLGWHAWRTIHMAASDNFDHFEAGKIADPNDAIYFNTRRMAEAVKGG